MDGLLKASEEVDRLNKDINTKVNILDGIKHLMTKFPDLMIYRSPSSTKHKFICCSSSVNNYVDSYDYTESNNVEPGEVTYVFAWPYTTIDSINVYSNPPYYLIGAVNNKGFGIIPAEGWDDLLASDNISNSLIRKIRTFLKSKPPIDYTE
jgi:hypothetical protein